MRLPHFDLGQLERRPPRFSVWGESDDSDSSGRQVYLKREMEEYGAPIGLCGNANRPVGHKPITLNPEP